MMQSLVHIARGLHDDQYGFCHTNMVGFSGPSAGLASGLRICLVFAPVGLNQCNSLLLWLIDVANMMVPFVKNGIN
jgi:hypothetical protein